MKLRRIFDIFLLLCILSFVACGNRDIADNIEETKDINDNYREELISETIENIDVSAVDEGSNDEILDETTETDDNILQNVDVSSEESLNIVSKEQSKTDFDNVSEQTQTKEDKEDKKANKNMDDESKKVENETVPINYVDSFDYSKMRISCSDNNVTIERDEINSWVSEYGYDFVRLSYLKYDYSNTDAYKYTRDLYNLSHKFCDDRLLITVSDSHIKISLPWEGSTTNYIELFVDSESGSVLDYPSYFSVTFSDKLGEVPSCTLNVIMK